MAISREVQGLINYIGRQGVPHRVTATVGKYRSATNPCSPHSSSSLHCADGTDGQGLAIDLAEPTASANTPGLLRIFSAFGAVESRLSELIYSGAPYNIKNGKRVPRYAIATHWNHIHVAVPRGVILSTAPPSQGVKPMYDPPLQPIAAVWQDDAGRVIAAVTPDGEVYAWATPWAGNVKGQSFWGTRKAAKIGPRDDGHDGYMITATTGEKYRLPV